MATHKKPADLTNILFSTPIQDLSAPVVQMKEKDLKAPPNHMQTIIDGMGLFFWWTNDTAASLKDYLDETMG